MVLMPAFVAYMPQAWQTGWYLFLPACRPQARKPFRKHQMLTRARRRSALPSCSISISHGFRFPTLLDRDYASDSMWSVIVSFLCCCSIWTCSPFEPHSFIAFVISFCSFLRILLHVQLFVDSC